MDQFNQELNSELIKLKDGIKELYLWHSIKVIIPKMLFNLIFLLQKYQEYFLVTDA